ncbi:MAG: hypothetical protein ACTSPW_09615, partial [Promethearchaeota archaeon]
EPQYPNIYLNAFFPDYIKEHSEVIFVSNGTGYIKNVSFTNCKYALQDNSEKIIAQPIKAYRKLDLKYIPINASGCYQFGNIKNLSLRLYFDISNFSLKDNFNYFINFSYSISNNSSLLIAEKWKYADNEIFSGSINNSSNIINQFNPISEGKIIDLYLYMGSTHDFNVNFTFTLYGLIKNSFNSIYYLIEPLQEGKANIKVNIEFSETVKVNGIICNNYSIPINSVCDFGAPLINISANKKYINYTITDDLAVFGIFIAPNFSVELSSSGSISIPDNINYFLGYFVLIDEAGNYNFINFEYNRSELSNPKEHSEGDENQDEIVTLSDLGESFRSIIYWGFIGIMILVGIGIAGYFIVRRIKNKIEARQTAELIDLLKRLKGKEGTKREVKTFFLQKEVSKSASGLVILGNISSCISISLIQTAILGLLIFLSERNGIFYLTANSAMLYPGELLIPVIIAFLAADFCGEYFRQKILPYFNYRRSFLRFLIIFPVVIAQFSVFVVLHGIFSGIGLIKIECIDYRGNSGFLTFAYVFFILMLTAEALIDLLRYILFERLFIGSSKDKILELKLVSDEYVSDNAGDYTINIFKIDKKGDNAD